VRDAVTEVLPQAQERRIDLGLAREHAAQVRGQPDALLVLLRNLLENAVKYAPEGGRVDIGIEPVAGGVALVVEDDGPGIPEAEHARVFDRFYRTADATGPGQRPRVGHRADDRLAARGHGGARAGRNAWAGCGSRCGFRGDCTPCGPGSSPG
jgi:hypothetical protein